MVSEAQKKARAKWESKNKERKKYINSKSRAKTFILTLATLEDLDLLEGYINERKNLLKK